MIKEKFCYRCNEPVYCEVILKNGFPLVCKFHYYELPIGTIIRPYNHETGKFETPVGKLASHIFLM